MLQDAIDPAALKRVLVIKLRHHGDVLLTSPVFTTLKRCAPQAELDALVYADTAPMLRGHPALATPGEEERADTVVALHQSGYRIALLEGRLGGTISRARLRDYSYRDIRAETERAVARLIARLGLSKVVATLQRSLAEHKNLNG